MILKKISICVPCYNEEENIENMYNKLKSIFDELGKYDYEIIFSDNCSTDGSAEILKRISAKDKHVKVILNMRNYGPDRSCLNCLFRATGDAIISLPCDFQEPPDMIPVFLEEWEKGNLVVWGQKLKSKENPIKFFFRKIFYKIIKSFSENPQIENTTGFGVMDRTVLECVKETGETKEGLRNLIPELGFAIKLIPYTQQKRQAGKSSYNMIRYLNFSIDTLITTSKLPLRLATILGSIVSFFSIVIFIVYFIYKLIHWDSFEVGMFPVICGIFLVGAIEIMFIGIIGEYIGILVERSEKRPLVLEKELINFDDEQKNE